MPAESPVPVHVPSSKSVADNLTSQLAALVVWATSFTEDLASFERDLLPRLWQLGVLLVQLMAMARQERLAAQTSTSVLHRIVRHVRTIVGVVCLVRLNFAGPHGGCRLDRELGLVADRSQAHLLERAVRLSGRMSFVEAQDVLSWFVPEPPSIKAMQQAVLGLGAHAEAFFAEQPAPDDDGEVLVLVFDSKAIPTATERELQRRRGSRTHKKKAPSPRHRGRDKRSSWGPRKRRRPGDKSKNGRIGTLVVMYTLQRKAGLLLGPLNKKIYASMGPKEHAFVVARREATKRGFGPATRKVVQVVTDGDEDLAALTQKYFPNAKHTLDIMHALEYVAQAGRALHGTATAAFDTWFETQRTRLFDGDVEKILWEICQALESTPTRGPGNKARRTCLETALNYLEKRKEMMRYNELAEADLELGSGAAEGAINHVMVQRFDHGGMRWIRERAQPLLQLRCIDRNGDWEAFLVWVKPKLAATPEGKLIRLQRASPAPLPSLEKAA